MLSVFPAWLDGKKSDGKDVDRKGTYVNIQITTDSIANPDTMFKKIINNQNKSLEIIIKKSCSPVSRQNTHYVAPWLKFFMVLHILCYEEYTDFKNYMRDILD